MRCVLCAVLGFLLSGCLAPAPPEASQAVPGDPVPAQVSLEYDGSGCTTVGVLPWVEPMDVVPLLPPGFWPAEASSVVHSPASTGKGLILLGWTLCDEWVSSAASEVASAASEVGGGASAAGSVAILVDAPSVPGFSKEPGWDFYELVRITDDDVLGQVLQNWSWPAWDGGMEMRLDLQAASLGHARVLVELDGETAFDARTVGAMEYSVDGKSIRFWNQNERGLALHSLTTDGTGSAGGAECRLPAGTPLADLLPGARLVPGSACGDLVNSIVFHDVDWDTEFRFLPEATAR